MSEARTPDQDAVDGLRLANEGGSLALSQRLTGPVLMADGDDLWVGGNCTPKDAEALARVLQAWAGRRALARVLQAWAAERQDGPA